MLTTDQVGRKRYQRAAMATESTPEIEEERRLLYVAMTAIGGQIVQQRRGATDCGQFCEAASTAPRL
jgi:superfamily I DNA/RNA helicase